MGTTAADVCVVGFRGPIPHTVTASTSLFVPPDTGPPASEALLSRRSGAAVPGWRQGPIARVAPCALVSGSRLLQPLAQLALVSQELCLAQRVGWKGPGRYQGWYSKAGSHRVLLS